MKVDASQLTKLQLNHKKIQKKIARRRYDLFCEEFADILLNSLIDIGNVAFDKWFS